MSVHAIFTYLDNVLMTRVLSFDTDSQTTTQINNQITVEQYKVKIHQNIRYNIPKTRLIY
jgi:hypothetical protein